MIGCLVLVLSVLSLVSVVVARTFGIEVMLAGVLGFAALGFGSYWILTWGRCPHGVRGGDLRGRCRVCKRPPLG